MNMVATDVSCKAVTRGSRKTPSRDFVEVRSFIKHRQGIFTKDTSSCIDSNVYLLNTCFFYKHTEAQISQKLSIF